MGVASFKSFTLNPKQWKFHEPQNWPFNTKEHHRCGGAGSMIEITLPVISWRLEKNMQTTRTMIFRDKGA